MKWKPCPCCECDSVDILRDVEIVRHDGKEPVYDTSRKFLVQCARCGLGTGARSLAEAASVWNRRPVKRKGASK
jgi:hypothetical protein